MLRSGAMAARAVGSTFLPAGRYLFIALRGVAKLVLGALVVVVVALLVGFIAWDVLVFQPQRPKIDQLVASATEEERNPPEAIVRLVRADSGQRIALAASRVLIRDRTDPTDRQRPVGSLQWQMHG